MFDSWEHSEFLFPNIYACVSITGKHHPSLSIHVNRASDRVRKKITNYAEIFRNINNVQESVNYAENTLDYAENFQFASLAKVTSFHAAEIELLPKPRVSSQNNFKQKKLYWYLVLCDVQ